MADPVASRPLRILIVTQFFTPEMGAPAARFHDFGTLLAARGHRVSVVTGFPNSPSGRIPDDYRGRFWQTETIDGIEVHRSWLFASPRLTKVTKSLGFGSFAAFASMRALFGRLSADVVIATSPPPTVGIPGWLAARRLGVPMVFDVRDIWPEAIAAAGSLRSGTLTRGLEAIADALYRSAAAVTVVTEGKRERLIEKGVPAEKIVVIPNGVDLARFDGEERADELLRQAGIPEDRFVVVYAGIMNPAQGLDVLVDAAALLEDESDRRVCFALAGDGSERRRLEGRVRDAGLEDRVVLLGEQTRARIPAILRSADAVVVPLRPRRDSHTIPSKIYEAFASARPLLVSADGAPAAIVNETGAGVATPAADAPALADAIRRLAHDGGLCRELGKRGRAHAAAFDRRTLVDLFETTLRRVVANPNA